MALEATDTFLWKASGAELVLGFTFHKLAITSIAVPNTFRNRVETNNIDKLTFPLPSHNPNSLTVTKEQQLQITLIIEHTSCTMAKKPNTEMDKKGVLKDLKKKLFFITDFWKKCILIAKKHWSMIKTLLTPSFALYWEQLTPNLPGREILFGTRGSRLLNCKPWTISSQKSQAAPGSDISPWRHLGCPSWKLSFWLLTDWLQGCGR